VRPIDAGALTMGTRVSNSKSGEDVYQMLIYSKGAYVLHMLEMQYLSTQDQEMTFKNAMQQFVKEYSGKAATTEDWKASMERTMPRWMDLRGNGKLDWFFDEYVYGTELPHYTISSDFTVGADGVTSVHLKLTQSNVSKSFVMRIPLYLQLKNGQVACIANVVIHGSDTVDQTFALGKLPSPAKTMLLNYNADVLSDN
jgi:aminopeptidase N